MTGAAVRMTSGCIFSVRCNVTRPVSEMLEACQNGMWLHMPGHGGKAPFGPADMTELDLTELDCTDDLYHPRSGIAQAEEIYAQRAHAGATLFLHNGSTQGIHAMLQMQMREGDTVILPRNAHLSAVNACILGNLRIVWIPVRHTRDGYVYVDSGDAERVIRQSPQARRVLITRPDYYGGCMDLGRVCGAARETGMDVVVDEAHGAHLPWHPDIPSASAWHVRAWTQSCHKTMPALTGSAVMHVMDSADRAEAMRIVRREQTSSPSFLLMRSIDDARAWMDENGEQLNERMKRLDRIAREAEKMGFADPRKAWAEETGYAYDRSRLVIAGICAESAASLDRLGVHWEMYDGDRLVLLPPVGFGSEEEARLLDALRRCGRPGRTDREIMIPDMPRSVMDVRAAALADMESVPLCEAAGRIAGESAGIYPPGVPLVVPGEELTGDVLDVLRHTSEEHRFGVEGDRILCVKM